ncbi:MAG: hypothetical protein K6C12_07460 [Oscillospiraceae bacterium]|nr:hypothetical protein [Oscillospiraceae bacterium]
MNKRTAVFCVSLSALLLCACGRRNEIMPGEPPVPSPTSIVMASPSPSVRPSTAPTTVPTSAPSTIPATTATSAPSGTVSCTQNGNSAAATQNAQDTGGTATITVVTDPPAGTAATTAPTQGSTPTPTPRPTPTPTPVPVTAPTPTPTPTPKLPVVTKSPTDETVMEGGSCWFIARYENAKWAVWHFVSPDGQTDMTYEAMMKLVPSMEIKGGDISNLQLKNIPLEANGWRVYCRYSNDNGYVDTGRALISVYKNPNPTPTPGTGTGTGTEQVLTVNSFPGHWTESSVGLGTVDISQDQSGNIFQVEAEWRESAEARMVWTMTAVSFESGRLDYSDCECVRQFFASDGMYYLEPVYSRGTGHFTFNANGRLVWNSDMGDIPQAVFTKQ